MKHRWGKRSWWSRLTGSSSTQTCARCGSQLRIKRPLKLLPGRRRPRAVITRWWKGGGDFDELAFYLIDRIPPCVG